MNKPQQHNGHGTAARSEVARDVFCTFSFYTSVKARWCFAVNFTFRSSWATLASQRNVAQGYEKQCYILH